MRLDKYMFILALAVAAQGSLAQTVTPEPLLNRVWQWQTEGLEDTSHYTVAFLPGGQLTVQADCNRGRASYETFGENRLRIDTLALTRAACPPGSLERAFTEQLVSSTSYALEGETLVLYPVVEPGTMVFTPVSTPSGSGGEALSGGGTGAVSGQADPSDEIVFRAVGNEPGWSLELTQSGDLRFTYNYGEQEVLAPVARVDEVEGGTSYYAVTETYTLYAFVTKVACKDTMSGSAFETIVTVALNTETFHGCGRDLR